MNLILVHWSLILNCVVRYGSRRGINQISTLQRAGDTRWNSHLRSVSSLIKIFSPTCEVILKVVDVGATSS
jgi:hypothetical protein